MDRVDEYDSGRLAMIGKLFRRAAAVFLVILAFAGMLFFSLPPLLIAGSSTPKADVILNFALDSRSKADRYIAWLYREKVAPRVVTVSAQVSHEAFPADVMRERLVSLGIPAADSQSLRVAIPACRAMLLAETAKHLKAQGVRSALIICQPEDSRYLNWIASRVLGREGITAAVGYAPEDFEAITEDWYSSHWKVQRFVDEAMNLALDPFYSDCR
jgi:hypothetical protein